MCACGENPLVLERLLLLAVLWSSFGVFFFHFFVGYYISLLLSWSLRNLGAVVFATAIVSVLVVANNAENHLVQL